MRTGTRVAAVLLLALALRAFCGTPEGQDPQEWQRSNPDVAVYLPKGDAHHDGDNEVFLAFEAPGSGELLAVWTQSSVEGRGDNRIVIARSADGVRWTEPKWIAGTHAGTKEPQASWGIPIVSRQGRIYCMYTRELEAHDNDRQHSGDMGCAYSDDNGHTWTLGQGIAMPRNRYDHADPAVPKNYWLWDKPTRDRHGRWLLGYSQFTSRTVVERVSKIWCHGDSRCAFVRFENLDEGPDPKDIKATWLPTNTEGLAVPDRMFPQISVAQEPGTVLLPDGRLFVVMRTMTGHIYCSVSADDGATWREPEPLRYRDGGETVNQPVAPCPIYALKDGRFLLVFHNNDGTRGEYSQWKKAWRINEACYLRNPAFIAVGQFRAGAHQPIWFSRPKQILDTGGIPFGPKVTAEIATYPSLTEWKGKRMLWYPDRKHFLLGKCLPDALLADMQVE